RVQVLDGHDGIVGGVAVCPDGSQIATASWDGTVRVWDARHYPDPGAGFKLADTLHGHDREVDCVAYSPGGAAVVTAGWDGTVKVWDLTRGQRERTFGLENGAHRRVAFDPAGR